jgi:hypothetical protein
MDNYQYSIEQLARQKGAWPDIARECEVSYSWLCKFAENKIPNAAYTRVEKVAACLRSRDPGTSRRRSTDKKIP